MKEKLIEYWKKLEPIHGIIYFVMILAVSHFFWKFTVIGDESNSNVTFFGLNISAPFVWATENVAKISFYFLKNWIHLPVMLFHKILLVFDNHLVISIVWGCSGVKQMYIYACIIAFYRGPWKQKLWYIPAGLLLIYGFNIFRITIISWISYYNYSYFHFLHGYFFKYLFYGFIFLLWVLWEEKFVKK